MTSSSTASLRDLPFAWRISRYDPALRDERGAYAAETWTSIADVGSEFHGHRLTLAEYEHTEAAYLQAFARFGEESHVSQLQVRHLELGIAGVQEGDVISLEAAAEIVRAMLREEVICKLEAPANTFLAHVGFDLYLYVGAMDPCENAVAFTRSLGLFVEPDWPSPQVATG